MRSKELSKINLDAVVIPTTKAALSIRNENFDYDTELKIKIPSAMRGAVIPLASATLAIKHLVIDSVF